MKRHLYLPTLCLSLLPLLALGQLRHWDAAGVEVFFWDQFDTVFHGPDPFFERVAPPEEVSQMAAPIGQDAAGFIWIASRHEYILRFDGFVLERFSTPKPSGQNRYHVIDTATNSIWLNTLQGLCCFDMTNGQWQLYPNPISPADSIFSTVFFDPLRQLLLCSSGSNGVFEFDLSKQSFSKKMDDKFVDAKTGQRLDASHLSISYFQACRDSSFWVTCNISDKWVLAKWHPKNPDWQYYSAPFVAPATGKPDPVMPSMLNLYVDENEGVVWVGGVSGLIRFDQKTQHWQQFILNIPSHNFTFNNLYDIVPWGERHLALTSHFGLHFFDKKTLRFYNHQFFPTNLGSHWSHITHQPLLDRDGRLWLIAGVTGLFQMNPCKQLFSKPKHIPAHFSPHHLYADTASHAEFLLGYNFLNQLIRGCRIEQSKGKAAMFEIPFCQAGILPSSEGQRLWVTAQLRDCLNANGSICLLDLKTNYCKLLHQPVVGLPSGITTDSLSGCRMSKAPDGNIWFSSMRFGLVKYEPAKAVFSMVYPKSGQAPEPIAMVLASRNGKIWFVPNGGTQVLRLDPTSGQVDTFSLPPSLKKDWYCTSNRMAETSDGQIWVPVGRRLFVISPDQKTNQFSEVPNLRPAADALSTDEQGNLWCNTNAGLAHYNCKYKKWKILTTKDGLAESPNDEPVSNCHNDKMYLTGAASFRPSEFRFNTAPATPVFTGLRVREQQRDEGRFLNVTRRVHLRPGEDALTIEFAATNFTNPEDNQFAYRLVGESDWVEVGSRRSATFSNLTPGDYRFELRAANSDGFWNPKAEALDIRLEPHFYQTLWFKTLAAALALVAIFLLYKNRLRAAQRESLLAQKDAELRQQQAEFQQQVAELENAALRSQMNPHFIFNVLNSIHYFLDSNDARSASDYLAKFSRLVRLVLDHSSQKSVTLHNDLSALLLYLEMEALRFKGKLTYMLDVAPDIDQKYLRVPPMLIQPYVENAIWHGLMHKYEGGNVHIHIAQPDENLLRVTVEDDGIGRAAASALQSKSAVANKSKGMEMTAKRLALLGSTGHKTTEIQIEDLTDAAGQPKGTRVVIEIPV